ncbi:uncharacterized protein LOC131678811 [Topomyia yanbarensis]|uniref:uncharacterized protein LOC131678811 n=1 Tax=Topomyia yanbarensis TaxID=2498891 RepID=UPI00273BABF4|nr:uncharacterized protein LOC131678811 [Topomyia yanbarensis]XP_058815142.1 uncharacterized protein LOC131678811 [Topomyia yanbarensis]
MSLIAVPLCCECRKIAKTPISCSNCCRICCASCCGLHGESNSTDISVALHPVCTTCRSEEPNIKQDLLLTRIKQEVCWLHDKEQKLFCLSCEETVCGDCFLEGAAHMRHQIDRVSTVYKEKLADVENKIAILDGKAQDLQKDVAQSQMNLKLVQNAEQAVFEQIDALCLEAKHSVSQLINERKRMLENYDKIPAKKRKVKETLQKIVKRLPMEEFLKQQQLINRQCKELIDDSLTQRFKPVQFEDIGCELVPPYDIQPYTLFQFNFTTGWPFYMKSSNDILWNIILRKKDDLFVKVVPCDNGMVNFPYKLLVMISHNDLRKTIQKTFLLHGDSREEKIASVLVLTSEGYVDESDQLVVKIGLKPMNALVENCFLKKQILQMRSNNEALQKRLVSDAYINCKYCVSCFNVNISQKLNWNRGGQLSSYLVDRSNRHWCLQVHPCNLYVPNSNLGVFIALYTNSSTKCRYFVELIHDDPKKTVRMLEENEFKQFSTIFGWHSFVDRNVLLSDTGYYPNMILRFRFGVQPLDY